MTLESNKSAFGLESNKTALGLESNKSALGLESKNTAVILECSKITYYISQTLQGRTAAINDERQSSTESADRGCCLKD